MNYWMLTISQDNFAVTRSQGWRVQGFTRSQRRKTDRMQPGDRLLLYVREPRGFGFTATITSTAFQEDTVLWHLRESEETFPNRVRIRPEATLKEGQYAGAIDLAPRLEYLRRWPPERWPLAFLGELHLLPRLDFELIEGELQRLNGGRPRTPRQPPRQPRRSPGGRPKQDRSGDAPKDGAPGPAQRQPRQRGGRQEQGAPGQAPRKGVPSQTPRQAQERAARQTYPGLPQRDEGRPEASPEQGEPAQE
jgi:hypothetical protein